MILANGSTDVTTYFVLRDSTTHAPKADVTITDIDVYYQEEGAAQAAKVDLTALAAADSAHADSKGYHCGNSLYRIDWPDAAFDGGRVRRSSSSWSVLALILRTWKWSFRLRWALLLLLRLV